MLNRLEHQSSVDGPVGSQRVGAPICAIAVVLVGSVAGGAVADSLDEKLEEFSHWDIF